MAASAIMHIVQIETREPNRLMSYEALLEVSVVLLTWITVAYIRLQATVSSWMSMDAIRVGTIYSHGCIFGYERPWMRAV